MNCIEADPTTEACSLSVDDAGDIAGLLDELAASPTVRLGGRVRRCGQLLVACRGLHRLVGQGDSCLIERRAGQDPSREDRFAPEQALAAEVVGIDGEDVLLVPYGDTAGIGSGARVAIEPRHQVVAPDARWAGRVVDAFARPLDGGPPLPAGRRPYPLRGRPVPAERRALVGERLSLGVRALDLFAPCCRGQRLGIFAGSGVGKSTLLSMVARDSSADVMVIGLIGERGRELNEFLHRTLSPQARARSIIVVATSDQPAMFRRRAAYLTLSIAEALRDDGVQVLCLLDSVTRFAMALREIHLAAGEVPTSRGYPPSVFAELPALLERAGPGTGSAAITALFTVLVEGDDGNEPVADTVRGILDGHVVLDRAIAEGGRFPAVDVLRSVSRTAPGCYAPAERETIRRARQLLRTHADMAELIRLGAYRQGADPQVDEAIAALPAIEAILRQEPEERGDPAEAFARLAAIVGTAGE
ncbi:MAG: FliI/YscN family ATPase [Geminicoccaceae bacterium]